MSDSQRADAFMHDISQLERKLTECREKTAKQIFSLARRVQRRDKWFIGGFLAEVQEEWNAKNN